jgi:thiosulfate/3-mercaptopyruvate sulfurtransferase
MTSPLISTRELADALDDPGVRIVDASWHLDGRDGHADFVTNRIPGAVFFDLEASSDPDNALPHMLPSSLRFANRMGGLGLSSGDRIVVYDTSGIRAAPRAWWMLKTMGVADVRVLDGGLPKWIAEGRRVEHGPPARSAPRGFHARLDADAVVDLAQMRAAVAAGEQVLDARSTGRFLGQAPEPRAGLRGGHMPGALNLPFDRIVTPDGTLASGGELRAAFEAAGINLTQPVTTTCGSGVTAAILSLGLAVLGHSSRLYDGSWSEWGGRDDTPVETA